jgi:hypothetical protein
MKSPMNQEMKRFRWKNEGKSVREVRMSGEE